MADHTSAAILAAIIETLEDVHLSLIAAIARRAAADGHTNPDDWQLHKLAATRQLIAETQAIIRRNPTPGGQLALMLDEAATIGAAWADRQADWAGTPPANRPPTLPPQLVLLAQEAAGTLNSTRLGLARTVNPTYQRVISETVRLMAAGNATLPEAVAETVDRAARRGLPGFIDRAGRGWRPETYADMALRTVYQNAAREARITRLQERGENLVIVSDSPDECPTCRPWEGKILATSGPNPAADATLTDARNAGLFHPRCTHSVNLYREGLTAPTPARQNPEGWRESQKQRELERKIRESKRRLAAAEEAGTPMTVGEARRRLADDRRKLREFLDVTGRLPRPSGTLIPAP